MKRKFAFSEGTRTVNDWSTGDAKFDKVVHDMPMTNTVPGSQDKTGTDST